MIAVYVGGLVRRVGRCERHELAGTDGTSPRARYSTGERGAVHLEITGEDAPPHRIGGLLLQGF